MRSTYISSFTALILFLMLFLPIKSYSQIIAPSGNPAKAASQLVYYYDTSCNDNFDGSDCFGGHQDSMIQVTNTNDTTAVTIHVQIFRSFDPIPADGGDTAPVICDERNFIDVLTPNDTHLYDFDESEFFKNEGEDEANPGERTSIDVNDTKGFVIITPVVSEADLTAIAFEHLIGNTVDNIKFDDDDNVSGTKFRLNAMGRSAVDFATGEILADGTPLDGTTNGYVLIQPEEILFDFAEDDDGDVAGFAFSDVYGSPGLLGYQVTPSSVNWTSFVFDYKEDPTSCGIRPINCFDTMGLTEEVDQINEFLDADVEGDDLLCAGVDTADYPNDNGFEYDDFGWFRLFVSGLESTANHFAVHLADDSEGARWANSNKEEIDVQAIKKPSGESTRASSQLIYYYDQTRVGVDGDQTGDTTIQLTNTNDATAVTVHVQIFRTFDPSDDPDADPVFCDERNFIDILTPNDTHVYDLDLENFFKNVGETESEEGESTSIDVQDTKGFVIITPVVSEADLTAISFQHLIGTSADDDIQFQMNAVGRDAIDLTTGEILADGTPLDGVSTGFVVIQPEELLVDFAVADETDDFGSLNEADIVGIAFDDNYGPAGLLGYNITPATVNWTSFIFDFKEDPTSCGNRTVNCFLTVGINDTITQNNIELNSFTDPESEPGDLLCAGTETPDYPSGDMELSHFGWVRIFTTGMNANTNHIGFFVMSDFDNPNEQGVTASTVNVEGADLMYAKGEVIIPDVEPPAEDCSVEGDEDEDGFADCLDTDCATAEECETGETECADGMDNDGDGQADCADLGCDGFAGCEFGTETSCNDGIDNDGDGDVDGADSDCQPADDGGDTGDDGDGGGCTVASAVTASTAAANFLLPLLPLLGTYGIRRIRKRK